MHFSKVEICGVNTAKLQNLTDEEKKELLKKTKEGDAAAREIWTICFRSAVSG